MFTCNVLGGAHIVRAAFLFVALTCTLFTACTSGKQSSEEYEEESYKVTPIPASIVHNVDSIYYYGMRAYRDRDPKGMFITASIAYLNAQGDSLPEGIIIEELPKADTLLMMAADMGYQPAKDLIHCLFVHGCWDHSVPE